MTLILPRWLITTPHQPPKPEHGVRVVGDRIDANRLYKHTPVLIP